jgi:hypothetical protein
MRNTPPWNLGAILALTVAIGYALCSLVFAAQPEAAASFMTALFHGLDFRKLQSGQELFSFREFGYAVAVLTAWAFVLGTVFASLWRYLDRTS